MRFNKYIVTYLILWNIVWIGFVAVAMAHPRLSQESEMKELFLYATFFSNMPASLVMIPLIDFEYIFLKGFVLIGLGNIQMFAVNYWYASKIKYSNWIRYIITGIWGLWLIWGIFWLFLGMLALGSLF